MTVVESPPMLPGLAEAAAVLRASRVTQYRVRLVSSGFGDMLTVANFLSAIGDLLGLRFCGLVLPPSFSRPYYDELVDQLGLRAVAAEHRGGPELVIDDTSFAAPQRPLAALLAEQIRAHPNADTLLLTMRSIAAAQVVQGLAALRDPFFASGMRAWSIAQGQATFGAPAHEPSITLHLRLGDVAAVRLGGFVVIPEFARRETHPAGVVRFAALDRTPFAKKTFQLIDDCLLAARRMKQSYPGHRINLVSDGFERTRYMLLDPDLRHKLQARGLEFSDEQLDGWLEQAQARIRRDGGFDEIVFGEANTQDWVASVRLLLNSSVVASTARGFVANMLTFFAPSRQGQRFYSPLGTGIYADLGCIGLDQRKFSSFAEVVDDLHRDPPPGPSC